MHFSLNETQLSLALKFLVSLFSEYVCMRCCVHHLRFAYSGTVRHGMSQDEDVVFLFLANRARFHATPRWLHDAVLEQMEGKESQPSRSLSLSVFLNVQFL